MKKFLSDLLRFSLVLLLLFVIGLCAPPTPKVSQSMIFLKKDKDALLRSVHTPRAIFLGASNVLLGLNSEIVRDSLGLNPINASLFWGIGIVYMMDNALDYVRRGDIVVVSMDYSEFFDGLSYGRRDLVWLIMDVSPETIRKLRWRQWLNILPSFPLYSFSKYAITDYILTSEDDIYNRRSINSYGDLCSHWGRPRARFVPVGAIRGELDVAVLDELSKFRDELQRRGAQLYMTFPAYDTASFSRCALQARRLEAEFRKRNLSVLGNPERYVLPDSVMYDGPGHLTKEGATRRTQLVVEDLRSIRSHS